MARDVIVSIGVIYRRLFGATWRSSCLAVLWPAGTAYGFRFRSFRPSRTGALNLQILQHLEQLDRMQTAAARQQQSAAAPAAARRQEHMVSWVQHSTCSTAALLEGILSGSDSEEDGQLAGAALRARTEAQRAAAALARWQAAADSKPADDFDADAQLKLPGLADVAVVSRGGWQRHGWKACNQDAFLALPLAAVSPADAAKQSGPAAAVPAAPALALGVFDGHGRQGGVASAHLRNALASGLLAMNQLGLLSSPAAAGPLGSGNRSGNGGRKRESSDGSGSNTSKAAIAPQTGGSPAEQQPGQQQHEEAAALLERCFAAAADTMPSCGADLSLSGSTAVLCLVQPGRCSAQLDLLLCAYMLLWQQLLCQPLPPRPERRVLSLLIFHGRDDVGRFLADLWSSQVAWLPTLPVCSVTAAWAGDSRAVLGLRAGRRLVACALTHDHRPCRSARPPLCCAPLLPGGCRRLSADTEHNCGLASLSDLYLSPAARAC
jgi:serine/threonine protein phosphatase PrpC